MLNLEELVSACVDLAQKAGEVIREVHRSGKLNVQIKGKTLTGLDDPLTEADLRAQQLIIRGLRNVWGEELSIIGEEDCEIPMHDIKPSLTLTSPHKLPENLRNVNMSDIVIYIDPLDATREFTLGNTHCVITLIGISIKGEAVAGVMHQPFVGEHGRTMWGVNGFGVVDDTCADVITGPRTPSSGKIRLVTTASHSSPAVDDAIRKIAPDEVIRAGGAGYKVLMLIDDLADLYVYPTSGCKLWDTCAPHAILNAMGGKMTDATGAKIDYTRGVQVEARRGILVALRDHATYLEKLRA